MMSKMFLMEEKKFSAPQISLEENVTPTATQNLKQETLTKPKISKLILNKSRRCTEAAEYHVDM